MNATQNALLKAMDARLLDPVVATDNEHGVSIWGRRDDLTDTGTIIAVSAMWHSDGSSTFLIRRQGHPVRLIGYRELVAELRTGQRAETGAENVQEGLGALYVDTVKATPEERAAEREHVTQQRAAKKAVTDAVKAAKKR